MAGEAWDKAGEWGGVAVERVALAKRDCCEDDGTGVPPPGAVLAELCAYCENDCVEPRSEPADILDRGDPTVADMDGRC